MTVVNMHEAKTQLSRLIARVEQGEEILIGRSGRPVARLVPVRPAHPDRGYGTLRGAVTIHDDFDELPEDIAEAFGALGR